MRAIDAKHFLLAARLLRDKVESFDVYPYALPVLKKFEELEFHLSVTFLIGENGTGKSTLLEALAVAAGLNAEGGSRHFNFSTRKSHSDLYTKLRLVRGLQRPRDSYFLRAESYFNVATEIERLDGNSGEISRAYGGLSLHEQSHGESFFALFKNRFRGKGLYFLDEPEAALSPARQMSFLCILNDLVKKGAQFIISTHSPIIMAYPDAWIYALDESGLVRLAYEETEHYNVSRDFLNNRDLMLTQLLGRK